MAKYKALGIKEKKNRLFELISYGVANQFNYLLIDKWKEQLSRIEEEIKLTKENLWRGI